MIEQVKNNEIYIKKRKLLNRYLGESEDPVSPVVAYCKYRGLAFHGVNWIFGPVSREDIEKRTDKFYQSIEHAEENMVKKMRYILNKRGPETVWVTTIPCIECQKLLREIGVKKVYYWDDHWQSEWSKEAHEHAIESEITFYHINE